MLYFRSSIIIVGIRSSRFSSCGCLNHLLRVTILLITARQVLSWRSITGIVNVLTVFIVILFHDSRATSERVIIFLISTVVIVIIVKIFIVISRLIFVFIFIFVFTPFLTVKLEHLFLFLCQLLFALLAIIVHLSLLTTALPQVCVLLLGSASVSKLAFF